MALKPGDNDVLSGRGAWFNQHPGNEQFRRMLNEQKDVYMASTKKQKMDISKAIVEVIYSKDPPGRFLKQCPKSCQWNELSKREAADRVAQAMAYAVRGKDISKRKKEELRRSRQISQHKSKNNDADDADVASSQHADDRPTTQHQLHSSSNQLEDNASSSSSVTNQKLTARNPVAGDTNNTAVAESATMEIDGTDSAADRMHLVPGNSTFRQQLQSPPQMDQSSDAVTLPTSSIDQRVTQNGLVRVLAQAVQQQRRHHDHTQQQQQQQLQLLQSNLAPIPNPLIQLLHTQTPLQPTSLEGLTHQLLAQAQQQQQQQQQQQHYLQQFLLLQHLLHAQNMLSTDSLLTTLPPSAPSSASQGVLPTNNGMILNGASSSNYSLPLQSDQAANMNILQNLQQQSNPSLNPNALLLSNLLSNLQHQPNNNVGIISALQGAQQLDQLQSSLRIHHSQQLLSSPPAASNQSSGQLLDHPHQAWQTALLLQIQNLQDDPPSIVAQPSANAASASTRQDESGVDGGQSMPEEEPT